MTPVAERHAGQSRRDHQNQVVGIVKIVEGGEPECSRKSSRKRVVASLGVCEDRALIRLKCPCVDHH